MLKSTFIAGGFALLLASTTTQAAALDDASARQLEPALNGEVSATGLFPSQEMEDAFNEYLVWTRAQGLSRLAAFEPVVRDFPEGQGSLSGRFPNQAMEDQFKEYLAWTGEDGGRIGSEVCGWSPVRVFRKATIWAISSLLKVRPSCSGP
jgi:hypothetical protein